MSLLPTAGVHSCMLFFMYCMLSMLAVSSVYLGVEELMGRGLAQKSWGQVGSGRSFAGSCGSSTRE